MYIDRIKNSKLYGASCVELRGMASRYGTPQVTYAEVAAGGSVIVSDSEVIVKRCLGFFSHYMRGVSVPFGDKK